jgi:hypothetical protein
VHELRCVEPEQASCGERAGDGADDAGRVEAVRMEAAPRGRADARAELLAELGAEFLRDRAPESVGRLSWRKTDQHLDRLVRVSRTVRVQAGQSRRA